LVNQSDGSPGEKRDQRDQSANEQNEEQKLGHEDAAEDGKREQQKQQQRDQHEVPSVVSGAFALPAANRFLPGASETIPSSSPGLNTPLADATN
jgi:hypothetical protein